MIWRFFRRTRKLEQHSDKELVELRKKVNDARAAALPRDEVLSRWRKKHELMRDFVNGKIGKNDLDGALRSIKSEEGTVTFYTLHDLRRALSLTGVRKERIEKIIAHENAHLNKALSLGCSGVYGLRFCVLPDPLDKRVSMTPYVSIQPPTSASEQEKRRIMREIAEAPEELSDGDMVVLGIGER